MKKNKVKKKANFDKTKLLKIILIVLVIILIVEIIVFGYKIYSNRKNTSYYQLVSDVVSIDSGYVGVGLSDFKNSKFNEYKEDDYQKAVIFEFNKKEEVVKEVKLDVGYKSYFNNIEKVSDGYIAVGTIQMNKEQVKNAVGEAMIVKYDNDFKLVWRKNVKILDNTEFLNVKVDDDNNIIVVGRSVYAADMIGNHKTGGAIIMKFDSKGKELMRANYGGPQTGVYNDFLIEDDGYVVVGASSNVTGMIRKYDFNGKEVWRSIYAYTDQKGFTGIEKVSDGYVVTGSKIPDKKETNKYKALLVKYDKNGKVLNEVTYREKEVSRFDDVISSDGSLLAVGFTGKFSDKNLITDGLVVKYDEEFEEEKVLELNLERNDVYSKIYKISKDYLVLGYTNSKYKNTNGYDYYPVFDIVNSNLKK